jgi:hypothetical protein
MSQSLVCIVVFVEGAMHGAACHARPAEKRNIGS